MSAQKKNSWMVWGSAILLVMLVAYPLSIGPLVCLGTSSGAESGFANMGPEGENGITFVLSVVYWPLEQAGEAFPNMIGTPLLAYVDWWAPPTAIPPSAPLPAPPIPPDPPAEAL